MTPENQTHLLQTYHSKLSKRNRYKESDITQYVAELAKSINAGEVDWLEELAKTRTTILIKKIIDDLGEDGLDIFDYHEGNEVEVLPGLFIETAEVVGGGKGGGETHYVVLKITSGGHEEFWQINGWYASYDGAYLDGEIYRVIPRTKAIIVYERM